MENPSEMTFQPKSFERPSTNHISVPSLQRTKTRDPDLPSQFGSSLLNPADNSVRSQKITSCDGLTSLPSSNLQSKAPVCTVKRCKYEPKSPVDSCLPKCSCSSCQVQNSLAVRNHAVFPSFSYRPFRTYLCEEKKPRGAVVFGNVQLLTYDKKSGCVYKAEKVDISFGGSKTEKKERHRNVSGMRRGMQRSMQVEMLRKMERNRRRGVQGGMQKGMVRRTARETPRRTARGTSEGTAEGISEGISEGIAKGIARGIARGIKRGMEIIRKLIIAVVSWFR